MVFTLIGASLLGRLVRFNAGSAVTAGLQAAAPILWLRRSSQRHFGAAAALRSRRPARFRPRHAASLPRRGAVAGHVSRSDEAPCPRPPARCKPTAPNPRWRERSNARDVNTTP